MLFVFFNTVGVIHQEFVPEGQKVNAEFYVGVLDGPLKRILRVRTAKFQSSEWFLLHDNTPSHNTAIVKKFLANRNVAVLHHPPYSPDLAPADYLLFPKLKFFLKGGHFHTVEEIQCAVIRELNNISKTASLEGVKKLKERANKCVKCILKNKNKSCPYKKLSVFYNSCLKTYESHHIKPCRLSLSDMLCGQKNIFNCQKRDITEWKMFSQSCGVILLLCTLRMCQVHCCNMGS